MHCPHFESAFPGVSTDWVPAELPGAGFAAFAVLADDKVESAAFTLEAPFIWVRRRKVSGRPGNLVAQFSASVSAVPSVRDKR